MVSTLSTFLKSLIPIFYNAQHALSLHVLPPPRSKYLRCHTSPLLLRHQVDPLMSLDIHCQLLILKLALTRPLDQMHMHDALSQRSLHIEPKSHVLSAPPVRLLGAADEAIPC
jgi:hypothetical protein